MKKALSIALVFIVGLAIGRFSLPSKVVTETKIVEVEKKVTDVRTDKTDNSVTRITETKRPDGSVTKITEIRKDVDISRDKRSESDNSKSTDLTKTVTYESNRFSVNGLAVTDILRPPSPIIYGAQVEYRLLGPIRTGILGFSNGLLGISLGVQF